MLRRAAVISYTLALGFIGALTTLPACQPRPAAFWTPRPEPFPPTSLRVTNQPYDLAVDNQGQHWPHGYDFLVLKDSSGATVYALSESFQFNDQRQLVTATGEKLYPTVAIPASVVEPAHIREDGVVLVRLPDAPEMKEVGQILTGRVVSPFLLTPVGRGRFRATGSGAEPVLALPGSDWASVVRQGMLDATR